MCAPTLDIERYRTPFPPFTPNRRKRNAYHLALRRDRFKCAACGSDSDLTIHHRKGRKEGGEHVPSNLETLCVGCHRAVHSVTS